MKLYHVSYVPVQEFVPRVPECRAEGEDTITPRICFTPQIESCINAKPSGMFPIIQSAHMRIPISIYVYEIESEDYDHDELLTPPEVKRLLHCKDAIVNQEYCLLCSPKYLKSVRKEVIGYEADWYENTPWLNRLVAVESNSKWSYFWENIVDAINRKLNSRIGVDSIICDLGMEIPEKFFNKYILYLNEKMKVSPL